MLLGGPFQDFGQAGLGGIEQLVNLSEVDFAHNAISDLAPLTTLSKLEHLNLDDNRVTEIPQGLSHVSVRQVSLNHNAIRRLDNLVDLPNLESLSLAGNGLEDLSSLATATSLRILNLSHIKKLEFF